MSIFIFLIELISHFKGYVMSNMDWFKEFQRKNQKIRDRYIKIHKKEPTPKCIRDIFKAVKKDTYGKY